MSKGSGDSAGLGGPRDGIVSCKSAQQTAYVAGDDRWDRVLKSIAVGGTAGLGLYGIAGIIRELGLQRAHDRALASPGDTDENTIILTVPRRKAAALKTAIESSGVGVFEKAADGDDRASSVKTFILARSALPLSALAAYIIGDKLHSANIKSRLKKEEAAARSEFIDLLGQKQASDMDWALHGDDAFEAVGLEKEGQEGKPRWKWRYRMRKPSNTTQTLMNVSLGNLGMLALLGATGTAYITKRVMDARDDSRTTEGWDPPKIKRVVVRSTPLAVDTEDEKTASAADIDSVRSAIAITMSALSGKSLGVLDTAMAKQAMAEAGTSKAELYAIAEEKQGAGEGDRLTTMLQGNAKLRQAVLAQAPKSHPLLNLAWYNEGGAPKYLFDGALKSMPTGPVDTMMRPGMAAAAQKYYDNAGMLQRWKLRRAMAMNQGDFNKMLINDPSRLDAITKNMSTAAGPAPARKPINLKPMAMRAMPAIAGAAAMHLFPKGMKWLPMAAGLAGSAYMVNKSIPGGIGSKLQDGVNKVKAWASPGAQLGTAKAAAFLPSVSGITSSFLGSTAANRAEPEPREHGAALAEQQVAMIPTSGLNALAGRIRIEADPDDADAQAFLAAKRTRLSKVLKQLLAEGELRAI